MFEHEFLSVESSARVSDVVELLYDRALTSVVVHDEDEDDFYVVPAGDIAASAQAGDDTMGTLLGHMRLDPVAAVEVGPVAEAPALRTTGETVLLADGVVRTVVGERTVRRNGGGGQDNGDDGLPLGVAVEYPESVVVGETVSLLISLTGDATSEDAIPIVAALGDAIDIVVSPKVGFVVAGRAQGRLVVGSEPDPLPLQIQLTATALGLSRVVIYAFRDTEALGSLTIAPEVVTADAATAARPAASRTELASAGPAGADLELVIFEQPTAAGERQLLFRLSSPGAPSLGLNLRPFGPITLGGGGPGPYFTELYKQIERLRLTTESEREAATQRLHAVGSELFSTLIPPELQTLLWELKERIATVWVQSEEPWIPWEICRLQGKQDGRVEEGQFFCEAFEFARWIPGIPRLPEVRLTNIGLIVPPGSGLTSAAGEAAMLHALAGPSRQVADVTPTYVGVRNALSAGTLDGIHFAGHGVFPDQSNPSKAEIELDGGQSLRPTDISGNVSNLGLAKPIVFLNACQAGRQSRGLTGVGGWAAALLRAGASAFVGAHWEVDDDLACRFATAFYDGLLGGATIAGATRAARLGVRAAGDPTWLAYTLFADPTAKVVES
ncbi:CHAT domain-containing protein [Solirubrobacter sp. CPCC 204708]|uniref:CHAT domain-containing protein n=1 Tax=Solirubrobacter deserti TaxID=2282478 RepID=A0ABT4RM19_9ACTN|nr:CHAT domain-containing protein [Solirubrobacter deserti]MBE2314461.1 CHAT domain-containing protein [Solirubrobacter deserti]MDA0139608.1 CHAT domain-containing protein [Solirubrobacter deserti]